MVTNTIGNAAQDASRVEQPLQPTMRTTMLGLHQSAPNTDVHTTPGTPRGDQQHQHDRLPHPHTQARAVPSEDSEELKVLTVIPRGPILDLVSSALEGTGIADHAIDLEDPEQVDNLCDDTCFSQATRKLRDLIADGNFLAGLFMHPGMTSQKSNKQGKKEDSRKAAAILLRMLAIIGMIISADKRTLLIVPWPLGSGETITDSKLITPDMLSKVHTTKYSAPPWQDDVEYELVTNFELDASISLEDVVRTFVTGNSDDTQHGVIPQRTHLPIGTTSAAAPVAYHDDADIDGDADDDLINQRVKQPVRLKGDDVETALGNGTPLLLGPEQRSARVDLNLETNIGLGHFPCQDLDHFIADIALSARPLVGRAECGLTHGRTADSNGERNRAADNMMTAYHRSLLLMDCQVYLLIYINLIDVYIGIVNEDGGCQPQLQRMHPVKRPERDL